MKYVLMCEGTNELTIMNLLLDGGKLKLCREDLLGLVPYHARQLDKSRQIQAILGLFSENIIRIRINWRQQ